MIGMRPLRVLIATVTTVLLVLVVPGSAWAHETYTVKRGDTLSHIAARHDVGWPALWEQNRKAVGSNPHLIFPGQVLVINVGSKAGAAKPSKAEPKPQPSPADAAPSGTVRPATGAVTSPYGMRTHPITGVYKLHSGTDYGYGDGRAYAARSGVVQVSHPGWAGNLVTISHGGGVQTRYAHLASVSVSDGQRVQAGVAVGRIGSEGLATGAHLHFEVLIDGEYVNPERWLSR